MTQEDKELLLKDLCARLPYGVIIEGLNGPVKLSDYYSRIDITKARLYKPYLRPMSSMTKEEVIEYLSACDKDYKDSLTTPRHSGADWLNAHHFDYRGLIEKGLALEAPEGMYN